MWKGLEPNEQLDVILCTCVRAKSYFGISIGGMALGGMTDLQVYSHSTAELHGTQMLASFDGSLAMAIQTSTHAETILKAIMMLNICMHVHTHTHSHY